jgi:hypothetical protein
MTGFGIKPVTAAETALAMSTALSFYVAFGLSDLFKLVNTE